MLVSFARHAADLFPPGCRVVAACSGGSDSSALVLLLAESGVVARADLAVAHFDHRLRPESPAEARQVADFAARLGLTFFPGMWRNPEPGQGNLAARARHARLGFLLESAQAFQASRVATGHQREDQAETFADRLLRDAGVRGLAAMARSRPLGEGVALVRPLLAFSRAQLAAWLTTRGVTWISDPGNRNPDSTRGRIRHGLLPCMETVTGLEIAPLLARAARRMGEAHVALEWSLARVWPELDPQSGEGRVSLAWKAWVALPEELRLRAVGRLYALLHAEEGAFSGASLDFIIDMSMKKQRSWRIRLKGMILAREGERLSAWRPAGRFFQSATPSA